MTFNTINNTICGGAQGHNIVSRSQNQELPGRNWNHKLGGYAGSEAIDLDIIKEVLSTGDYREAAQSILRQSLSFLLFPISLQCFFFFLEKYDGF